MIKDTIHHAVSVLKQGGIVAFPTETVYGLGGDAKNPDALRKIFIAKQRPMNHPLIVHIPDVSQLSQWARNIPPHAFQLMDVFWPGPLTFILQKAPHVSDLITGFQDTIGIRIPNHPIALQLLKEFNGALAAPSANRFGHISPTTADAVREELGNEVDAILEGGQCTVGLESTIVDVRGDSPVILRPGMITAQQIEIVLQKQVTLVTQSDTRVSGSLESHYAPRTPTYLMEAERISEYVMQLPEDQLPCVVLTRSIKASSTSQIHYLSMPNDPNQYAHDLYRTLRECDHKNYKQIIIETVPTNEAWIAIQDRLRRACAILS